jgi:hypothetical protein
VIRLFPKLSRRIFGMLLAVSLIGTACVGWTAYALARNLIASEFSSVSTAYYQASADNLSLYLNYIEETAKATAASPLIVSAMRLQQYSSEVPKLLDGMKSTTDLNIQGITLYPIVSGGFTYSGNAYSGYPTLRQMRENADIDRFLTDTSQSSQWLYRNDHIDGYYNNVYRKNGIFSYLLKVPSEKPSALMVVDLDAGKLTDFFPSNSRLFDATDIFLAKKDAEWIPLADAGAPPVRSREERSKIFADGGGQFKASNGGRLIVYGNIPDSDVKLALSVPLSNVNRSLTQLKWAIAIVSLLIGVLSAILFSRLRNAIIRPLAALYQRMRKYNSGEAV